MENIQINAMGKQCPIPVVMTKKRIDALTGPAEIEVLVDNRTAVENLTRLGESCRAAVSVQEVSEQEFHVLLTVAAGKTAAGGTHGEETGVSAAPGEETGAAAAPEEETGAAATPGAAAGSAAANPAGTGDTSGAAASMQADEAPESSPIAPGTVVVFSSRTMGNGSDELGVILMKGFIYALSQQDRLPETCLFYNGGAFLTADDSESLADLKMMEDAGVEILTCGTCADFNGIKDRIAVGGITNMYAIVEKMTQATKILKP